MNTKGRMKEPYIRERGKEGKMPGVRERAQTRSHKHTLESDT